MIRMLILALSVLPSVQDAGERALFDFEKPEEIACWAPLEEPAARVEASSQHATSGSKSLKITFAGGVWPAIRTTAIPDDWEAWHSFRAQVTVQRDCLAGFRVLQEKSKRGAGWDEGITRWEKTVFLKPGRNDVAGGLRGNYGAVRPYLGKVVALEIYLYRPRAGESMHVDHVRLSPEKMQIVNPFSPGATRFKVAGTDLEVAGVGQLAEKLKGQWKKPEALTVDQVEADFRKAYEKVKAGRPRAVLAVFREGQDGYAGWKDSHMDSHGPDANTGGRGANYGDRAQLETFMRHRSQVMRADLSAIPKGATIHAAQLLMVRTGKDQDPTKKPTMWVVEPCNRPWEEREINAYEYARDKFWKEVGGVGYGEDPDFLPVYLAHGPGTPGVHVMDFAEAVRFWTDGKHPNHGFMVHGDSQDYMTAWCREAPHVKNRPAILVIYEPAAP